MSRPKVKVMLMVIVVVCIFLVGIEYKKVIYKNKRDVKVSIIVPVYNREKYIATCMDSLINQTLEDIEIICIDDGSTDRSGKILDEYAKIDNRVIVIHQKNKGVSVARNRGLDYRLKGEYTTFVDSDDYVEKNTYRYLYDVAKAHDDDVVNFGWRIFHGNGKCPIDERENCSKLEEKRFTVSKKEDFVDMLYYNWNLWNKLYKTEILKRSGVRFIEDIVNGEDLVYNFMIIPYVKRYENVDKIFYNYRRTPDGITAKNKHNEGIQNCAKAIPAVCNQWRQHGILKGKEDFLLDTLMLGFWYLIEDIAKEDSIYADNLARSFGDDIYNNDVLIKCKEYTRDCVYKLETYRGNVYEEVDYVNGT